MATYTKETALYDTGKIGNDIAAAGQTATSYLTTVSGTTGISVHDANDTDNFVNMNSEGVGIYQDGTNVAQFGAVTRIGTTEDASITLANSSIVGRGTGGKKFFTFTDSSGTLDTYVYDIVANGGYSNFPHTSAQGLTHTFANTPTRGTEIAVLCTYRGGDKWYSIPFFIFTAGQSSSAEVKTSSVTVSGTTYNMSISMAYNGTNLTNIYVTSSPDNPPINIGIDANYYTSTEAPSYELGDGSATGGYAFIEGYGTEANANYSHAGGNGTIASGESQVVFGKYNTEDTNGEFAFIIGNGKGNGGSNDRHNALTVDWDGNVNINGIGPAVVPKYKINGTALSPTDLGEADYVTHRGTSGVWAYRKWKNGKVEAWATVTLASTTPSAWSSPVRIIDKNDNAIASGIFSSTPNMIASAAGNQYWMGGIWATSSTKYNVRVCTCATTAQAPVIKIYAWTN